ncbi:low molecular weight protein-tyrosine-phosphatase [Rhizobium sp. L1K21]|uniref:low molecular weight protein-tyrosine-phosphatase n=1 Tax=Rhizobium sp. L1K21 TaxID=2954933 RepID=UPI002092F736|nr:low molecular weight protein-tyrosine-phosphatase [Rhizobium sp. L1K21]MCO6184741.1 low molecular weight phosphotyrosine protein phosphatase [Rhizobium sp. L1K21]
MPSVLFVCLGNICRSPLAEGLFRHHVEKARRTEEFHIDSAGTGGWHAGDPPDPRSIEIARRYGIDITGQRARQLLTRDFEDYDLILGMDRSNVQTILQRSPVGARAKVHLFLKFADGTETDVPDPYYGGPDGFENVYHTLSAGCMSALGKL